MRVRLNRQRLLAFLAQSRLRDVSALWHTITQNHVSLVGGLAGPAIALYARGMIRKAVTWRVVAGRCVALALATVVGGCDSSTADPDDHDALSRRIESPTHSYLLSLADAIDTASHEAHYRWLKSALGIEPATKLQFHKYRDRAHLQRLTGRATNGFAEPGTPRFHTIWPWENHEGVHAVVILTLGHPPALFNEGVAVAHQTNPRLGDLVARWNGEPVHTIAARLDAQGQLPALDALLESPSFFSHGESVVYPIAGSWVRYLLDTRGLVPFKAYFASTRFDATAAQTRAAFLAAYGFTVDAEWERWRAFLHGVAYEAR